MRFAPGLAVLLALSAGCGRNDEVRRYQAPKDPMWRMIGAIAPAKDATWFFKVTGPNDRVGAHKNEALDFLRGLRVEDGEVRWTLPAGWREEKGGPARIASFLFGDRDPKLEMTVVRLPGDGGGLTSNVNRWRDQIGLEKIGDAEVAASIQKLAANGFELQVVDLVGPTRPAGGPRGGMARPAPEPPRSSEPSLDGVRSMFTFERPPGWRENPQPEKQRVFEFDAEGALVTFTIMGGEGGGLAANIDRWRTQAGLEPLGEQAVARSATPIRFVGAEGWLVEAIGKDRAILGVISLNSQFSMFLKMDGPPSAVVAQRDTFTRVAQSLQMRGRNE
ncbi:MAG TPA: hypothetical protein VNM14_21730 [Planctomycetota bacterium]|nr:hypothetical protein [Planctomycetota bacterium]